MKKVSIGTRLLSVLLALVMVMGLLPLSIWAAETDEPIVLIAGSDFQAPGGHTAGAGFVKNILAQIEKKHSTVDGFLFMGDYDYDSHNDVGETNTGITTMMTAVQSVYSDINYNNTILVQGNHDYTDSKLSPSGANDTSDYGVYVIHEDEYMDRNSNEDIIKTAGAGLEAYLNAKVAEGYDKPIFVVSHLPLHYDARTRQNGDSKFAHYIFDPMNEAGKEGLNIIYLFGHNHAYGYSNYVGGEAIYLPKGDSVNIAQSGSQTAYDSIQLNFTYMNAGYVGYYEDSYPASADEDYTPYLTMTVFVIDQESGEITVERYNDEGEYNLKSAGRMTGTYINNINVTANTTVYPSGQTINLTSPVRYTVTDSATGVTVTSQYTEDQLNLSITPDVTVSALSDTNKYTAYKAYNIAASVNNVGIQDEPAIITIPVPESYPLDYTTVYLVNGSTLTKMDATVKMVGGKKVASFYATNPGTYAVVSEVSAESGSLAGWTDVSTSGGYTYVLDTDGVNTGSSNRYLIVASGTNVLLSNSVPDGVNVTISDNTITLNTRNYDWYFSNETGDWGSFSGAGNSNGSYVVRNDSVRIDDSNEKLTTSTSPARWKITHSGSGQYRFQHAGSSSFWYMYWDGSDFGVSSSDSVTVRLYRYDGESQGTTGFAKLSGETLYKVENGATAAQALAAVQAGITGSRSNNANGSNATTLADSALTWTWVDTFDGSTAGYYTMSISYNGVELGTVEVEVPATGSTGNWIDIGGTFYNYELDTNGFDYGSNNMYLFVASDAAFAMNGDGTGMVPVTFNDGETIATVDSNTYAWYLSRQGSTNNRYYWITKNGTNRLYHENYGLHLGTNDNGNWSINESDEDEGLYRFSNADGGSTWYLYYDSADHRMEVSTSSSNRVRLYKYTGTTTTTGYAKIVGDTLYTVNVGTSVDLALNAVKAGITGYFNGNTGSDNGRTELADSELTWTWIDEYDPNTPGYYTVQISYKNKVLGTVEVRVEKKPVSHYSIGTMDANGNITAANVGYVNENASKGATVKDASGNIIYVITHHTDGTTITTPLTVGMLSAAGVDVPTTPAAVRDGLTVTYKEHEVTSDFTLNIMKRQVNDYPEYPDQGAVRVNKTATGIDFQSTGIAKVELSASGVPVKKGADVIIMLDTSSSMTSHNVTGTSQTRAAVLEASLRNLIQTFKTPGEDGELLDIRVAMADFNGFYGDGHSQSGTPYDRADGDHMNDDDVYTADSEAKVYTGDGTLTAGAFIDAVSMLDSYTLNYTSGTNYDYAFDAIYQLGASIKQRNEDAGEDRDLFVIFMSDGAPMQWNYYHAQGNSELWENWITGEWDSNDLTAQNLTSTGHSYFYDTVDHDGDGMLNEHRMANAIKGDPNSSYTVIRKNANGLSEDVLKTTGQQYMYTVPGLGATMFSIAFDPTADGNVEPEHMETAIESIASAQTGSTQYYYRVTSAAQLNSAFNVIGNEIAYAATNARFVDNMGKNFNLQFETVTYTVDSATKTLTPTIRILSYELYTRADYLSGVINNVNLIGTRKGTPTVLETVTFATNSSGNLTAAYSDKVTGNILGDDGVIRGASFWYNTNSDHIVKIDPDGDGTADFDLLSETFYWQLGTVGTTELALEYYVYLTGSQEGEREAGAYATNEFADLYYTNYLGNECSKPTTSPVIAWKSANVRYGFYLVNEKGEVIVNQTTGETGSFANRIAITNPVLWQEVLLNNTGTVASLAVGSDGHLPEYYELYDEQAVYTVTINSAEGSKWEIEKGDGKVDSTYVTDFSQDVAFSNTANVNDVSYDYTGTVVWFAVVWTVQAVPDSVVIDYGLPVNIHVLVNDMFGDYGTIEGIGLAGSIPTGTGIGNVLAAGFGGTVTGTYGVAEMLKDADGKYTGVVRYKLNESNGMLINDTEQLAYAVHYGGTSNAGYYYATLTIIPATSIYYEDNFMTYEKYEDGQEVEDGWSTIGTTMDATQSEDRPGEYNLPSIDANEVYGYDKTYYASSNMAKYSLGSAKHVSVNANSYATAKFSFYGTGFDIVSLTSNKTGTIIVQVTDAETNGNVFSKNYFVDTYYGYAFTAEDTNGDGTVEDGEGTWAVTDPEADNSLYQIPVMKITDLTYGQYNVTINVSYSTFFDHQDAGSYDFYLDAIRVYDPANDGANNSVIEDAYVEDGEGWPLYQELRNHVIAEDAFTTGADVAEGIVFIDGKGSTNVMADYKNYGPNNELYLMPGQSIAFKLDLSPYNKQTDNNEIVSIVADVQIAIKSVNGKEVSGSWYGIDDAGKKYGERVGTLNSATDVYYSIKSISEGVIVITNDSADGAILSVTNIKITFTEMPNAPAASNILYMDAAAVTMTLRRMNYVPPFAPEEFEVNLTSKSVLVGTKAFVTVRTSKDVESISVNGKVVDICIDSRWTGMRTWIVAVEADEVGELAIETVAYNADGVASEATVNTVNVFEESDSCLGKVFGWIFG